MHQNVRIDEEESEKQFLMYLLSVSLLENALNAMTRDLQNPAVCPL
jgi:hypothetical protein